MKKYLLSLLLAFGVLTCSTQESFGQSGQLLKDEWHRECETLNKLYQVYPRRWGMRATVYNDPSPSNNGDYVLEYNKASTNRNDNGNWLKVADLNVSWGTGGGGSGFTTADNGLTANTATNVQLGGTLLKNTGIQLDDFKFYLNNNSDSSLVVRHNANGPYLSFVDSEIKFFKPLSNLVGMDVGINGSVDGYITFRSATSGRSSQLTGTSLLFGGSGVPTVIQNSDLTTGTSLIVKSDSAAIQNAIVDGYVAATTRGVHIRANGAGGDQLYIEGNTLQEGNVVIDGDLTVTGTCTGCGGGGGTPGGSDTQVQFNDAGAFGGDAGMTYNKTTDVLTVGGANLSGQTASTVAILDGSKNLISASTATYPNLTEFSYLKGTTSAVQTQMDAKAPLASPALTGTPTAPTATTGTSTTQIATTAFVDATKLSNFYKVTTIGALQTYISGLGAGVDVNIFFPAGNYTITTPIVINGKGKIKLFSEGAVLTNGLLANGAMFDIDNCTGLEVKQLQFDNNLNAFTTDNLNINNITGIVRFTNCDFYGFASFNNIGINCVANVPAETVSDYTYPGVQVSNCNFYNVLNVLAFDYNNNTAKGVGIKFLATSEYYEIVNCNFQNIQIGVWSANGANGKIANCNFLRTCAINAGTYYGAVYMADAAGNSGKTQIVNCAFNHNWGFSIKSDVVITERPATISNCNFIANAITPIFFSTKQDYIKVDHCYFNDADLHTTGANDPFGATPSRYVVFNGGVSCTVSNNTFLLGISDVAIRTTTTSTNTVISNNLFETGVTLSALTGTNISQGNVTTASVKNDQKSGRVTTGSIAGGASALVTYTFNGAFPDTNYTVAVSVYDTTASASALRVVHVESLTTTACVVRIENTSGGAITGTLHVTATHD